MHWPVRPSSDFHRYGTSLGPVHISAIKKMKEKQNLASNRF